MLRKQVKHEFLTLLSGMIGCGLISVYLGKELNWDLANYHFYNPYVFLYQRWQLDYWPISYIQVHFTPTLDFITYFFIKTLPPLTTMFLMGALHGINFWLMFNIATHFRIHPLFALILSILGLYGPTVLPGIGSFQHDNLISLFVLGFVLLQLKALQTDQVNNFWQVCASLLLGMAAGCKLTATTFVFGAYFAFAFVSIPIHQRMKCIIIFTLFSFIGLLLSSGYWMFIQWQLYHNPIFPFFNRIFHSTYFPIYNWSDTRFLPHDLLQAVLYPFIFSLHGSGDTPFRDFRYAIIYLLFTFYFISLFISKDINRLSVNKKWLFVFYCTSYIIWQYYFAIMRYIAPLEMLAPLLIYLLLQELFKNKTQHIIIANIIYSFIVATMLTIPHARKPWYGDNYFNINIPNFLNQRAVLLTPFNAHGRMLTPLPLAYLMPFLPSQWQIIWIPFAENKYHIPSELPKNIFRKPNQVFVLTPVALIAKMQAVATHFGYKNMHHCQPITSDRQRLKQEALMICNVDP